MNERMSRIRVDGSKDMSQMKNLFIFLRQLKIKINMIKKF